TPAEDSRAERHGPSPREPTTTRSFGPALCSSAVCGSCRAITPSTRTPGRSSRASPSASSSTRCPCAEISSVGGKRVAPVCLDTIKGMAKACTTSNGHSRRAASATAQPTAPFAAADPSTPTTTFGEATSCSVMMLLLPGRCHTSATSRGRLPLRECLIGGKNLASGRVGENTHYREQKFSRLSPYGVGRTPPALTSFPASLYASDLEECPHARTRQTPVAFRPGLGPLFPGRSRRPQGRTGHPLRQRRPGAGRPVPQRMRGLLAAHP